MEKTIIGRIQEKKLLNKLLRSSKPEFLAIYGRRRVGKTFLISEFYENKGLYFEITGSKGSSEDMHIARFCVELTNKFYKNKKPVEVNSWENAFMELKIAIDHSLQDKPDRPVILFLDELPWIAESSKSFMGTLDYYWNRYFSKSCYKNILLIVCGSAASWIIKNIIDNKGGLHNRVTQTIRLLPFTLEESKSYLESRDQS